MNFAGRLIVGVLTVIVVTIATLVLTGEVALRSDLERDIQGNLEREVRLAAQALPADSLQWQDVVEQFARSTGLRFTIIDSTGRVRAESDEPREIIPTIENHGQRPEVAAALGGGTGHDRRTSATIGKPLMYVAVRGGPGVVRVASPLVQADAIVRRAQRSILSAAAVALILGAVLALLAGNSIAQPLTAITTAARAIAEGATPRFPRSGIPDIDGLVRALREMHDQLDQRFTELRQERAESAALVEAMVEGVIAADARGRILTANGAARRVMGYGADEELPALDQLFRAKAVREVVDAVQHGESVAQRELDLAGQSILLSGRALPQGGALLVLHDVTELRRLEMVRRDFVANVSHELKTPLTSISGYAETLASEQTDPETTHRFLTVILSNARRMQRLVDDLLDLSRIESGRWQPSPEPLEAALVAREVWALLADRAAQKQVHFEIRTGPGSEMIFIDADALRQVLSNLFDNALRYTPAGGQITLETSRENGGVALRVRDTGSGIPNEHLPRIFERFYRADPHRSREEGGTGLGLAIVRHLIEAHGGHVSAESDLGAGTVVSCWLPEESDTRS